MTISPSPLVATVERRVLTVAYRYRRFAALNATNLSDTSKLEAARLYRHERGSVW